MKEGLRETFEDANDRRMGVPERNALGRFLLVEFLLSALPPSYRANVDSEERYIPEIGITYLLTELFEKAANLTGGLRNDNTLHSVTKDGNRWETSIGEGIAMVTLRTQSETLKVEIPLQGQIPTATLEFADSARLPVFFNAA